MSSFRDHLHPRDHARFRDARRLDAYEYGDAILTDPIAGPVIKDWLALVEDHDFTGITNDGVPVGGLFASRGTEVAPTPAATDAAGRFVATLSDVQVDELTHPLDSRVWRKWMNPEFYINRHGLRLEELSTTQREAALALVRASLSPEGFDSVQAAMRTNAFLGELVGLPRILNEGSYNINLFGSPSLDQPWGWSLYGHHLSVNCMFVGDRQFLTPFFLGAEPNLIDEGPHAGTRLLAEHASSGLALHAALTSQQREAATVYARKRDPAMPAGRLHPGDELHLGGAFQDNRVIPYEGVSAADLDDDARRLLLEVVNVFLHYQPDGPREARLREVEAHLDEAWLCWIGDPDAEAPFYYRIQSPVIMVEFDHHAGIFLANDQPERFHTHTLVRTPNGNDYGAAVAGGMLDRGLRLNGPA